MSPLKACCGANYHNVSFLCVPLMQMEAKATDFSPVVKLGFSWMETRVLAS